MDGRLKLLTLQEVIAFLKVSRSTVNRWRRDKGLPFIKIGKDVFFEQEAIREWVRGHQLNERETKVPAETIMIGYQSMNAYLWSSLLVKELRLFEAEWERDHPERPIHVNWLELDGPRQIEELAAGRLHIASLGDFPLVSLFHVSSLLPSFQPKLLAFDGKNSRDYGAFWVTPNSSALRLDQLADHRVAALHQSSSWHRLHQTFAQLPAASPLIVNQPAVQTMAHLLSNQIDASIMIEPFVSMIRLQEWGRTLPLEGSADDYLAGIAADGRWLAEHEEMAVAYVKALLHAHRLIREQPFKMALLIARLLDFPVRVVAEVLSGIRWDAAIYERDIQTLGRIGKAHYPVLASWQEDPFSHQNLASEFVSSHCLQEAAKQAGLPAISEVLHGDSWMDQQLY